MLPANVQKGTNLEPVDGGMEANQQIAFAPNKLLRVEELLAV